MLQPINNKVLIDADEKRTETKSGLYTGNYSVEGSLRRGTVVAVGPKVRELQPDDRCCFEVFVGSIVNIEGKDYYLILENEVIGKIEENV